MWFRPRLNQGSRNPARPSIAIATSLPGDFAQKTYSGFDGGSAASLGVDDGAASCRDWSWGGAEAGRSPAAPCPASPGMSDGSSTRASQSCLSCPNVRSGTVPASASLERGEEAHSAWMVGWAASGARHGLDRDLEDEEDDPHPGRRYKLRGSLRADPDLIRAHDRLRHHHRRNVAEGDRHPAEHLPAEGRPQPVVDRGRDRDRGDGKGSRPVPRRRAAPTGGDVSDEAGGRAPRLATGPPRRPWPGCPPRFVALAIRIARLLAARSAGATSASRRVRLGGVPSRA